MGKKAAPSFYAVAHGRKTGIFHTWKECDAQVNGFFRARFKGFMSEKAAKDYIEEFEARTKASSSTAYQSDKTEAGTPQLYFDDRKSTLTKLPNVKVVFKTLDAEEFEELQKKAYTVLKKAGYDVKTPPATDTDGASVPRRGTSKRGFVVNSASEGGQTEEVIANKKLKLTGSVDDNADARDNSDDFLRDPSGHVVVFTDGACSNNGKINAKAGIAVWFGDQHYLNISEAVQGRQTSNAAKIQAAERAIIQAKNSGINKLNVNTDSKFVINCITGRTKKWKKNGWKLKSGKEVINRVDLEKLDQATVGMDIKWTYVPGHQGYIGNEAAEKFAVGGISKCPCPYSVSVVYVTVSSL